MSAKRWTLEAGRTIKTPHGSFFLSYGQDVNGRAHFPDFCKLDRIARAIAALPDLLDALEWIAAGDPKAGAWDPEDFERFTWECIERAAAAVKGVPL